MARRTTRTSKQSATKAKPAARRTFGDVIAELRRRGPLAREDRFPSDIDSNLPPVEPVDL